MLGKHLSAFHKEWLGWLHDSDVFVVDSPGLHTVAIDAMSHPNADHYRMARIPIYGSGGYYTVEARLRRGEYDGFLPGDALIIYRVQPDHVVAGEVVPSWTVDTDVPPGDYGDNEGTMFRVGETYRDPGQQIEISIDAATTNGFRITIDTTESLFEVPCSVTDIMLATQADVDSFQATYGPCDTIEGRLFIGAAEHPASDIRSLAGLNGLRFVHDRVEIQLTRLSDLSGLTNLHSVGAYLIISSNESLVSLRGLDGLRTLGSISLSSNPVLVDLTALSVLTRVRNVQIELNASLVRLNGLEMLEAVDQTVLIKFNARLSGCSALMVLLDQKDDYAPGPAGPSSPLGIPDVGHYVEVRSNGAGCNSLDEIQQPPSLSRVLTGSWYEPDMPGAGFMFHAVSEDLAVGYYYGYDFEGGRFWLIGVHDRPIATGEPLVFDAVQPVGGNFANFRPDDVSEVEWGTITLELDPWGLAAVRVTGEFPGGVRADFESMLSPLGEVAGLDCCDQPTYNTINAVTGSWYDPATSGQGFAIHKVADDVGVVYFYGFDKRGDPLWLIGVWEEQLQYGHEILMTMLQVSGGTFGQFDPSNIVEEPWGSLTLRIDGCGAGSATLSGVDGQQIFALKQLAGSDGLACSLKSR